jgi:HTH-type transcriptional regulator/antitoxin HipB
MATSSSSSAGQPPYNWIIVTSSTALGNAIRAMRVAKGLSKLDAAQLCGVGRRFLIELEDGKPTARLDKVLAVMKGLGITALVLPSELTHGMPESG